MKLFLLLLFVNTIAVNQIPYDLLKKYMPEDPVIVEAGAQFGEDISWKVQMWPNSQIHAFEPSPESYDELKKNTLSFKNVTTHKLALSNNPGLQNFYLAGGASSLLKPSEGFNNDYFHADLNHPIQVEVIQLDQWAQQNQVKKIDFIWLDTEGNELNVLQSGLQILKTVKLIFTEINFNRFWEKCVLYEDLKSFLVTQGFVEVWRDISPNWNGNVLFVRKG